MDLNALVAGDEYEFKVYEKVVSGGTQRVAYRCTFAGAQPDPIWVSIPFSVKNGWDMTLDRLAGSDRTIAWSIRAAA